MGEKPILFSGPLVRAILRGEKTQTRRVIKPQPSEDFAPLAVERYEPSLVDRHGEAFPGAPVFGVYGHEEDYPCPYGAPGDTLWVRETWAEAPNSEDGGDGMTGYPIHRADYDPEDVQPLRWRPSIHMPRWACRLTLRVTGIRVERVQDISEEDARAEGVIWSDGDPGPAGPTSLVVEARDEFRRLWDTINGPRGFGWEANPWVWVVEFEREEVARG